jgi:carnitine-CoA ligase
MTTAHLPASLRTIPALLQLNAERDPHGLFLADPDGSLTRAEVYQQAQRMAGGLATEIGVTHGDRVAILLGNCRPFVQAWFGLSLLGAIEVPVNPALTGFGLIHILNHSGSRALVTDTTTLRAVADIADHLQHLESIVVVGDDPSPSVTSVGRGPVAVHAFAELLESVPLHAPAPVTYADISALMYTSGSTGPPKGARIPHGQHYMNGWQAWHAARLTPGDSIYVCLPLHHNMAQGYGVLAGLVSGSAVYLAERFDRTSFWHEVRACGATVLPFVGALFALLNKQPPDPDGHPDLDNPIRVAYGIPISSAMHEEFERRFGIELIHAYGSTEATIPAWNTGPDRVLGAAGRVLEDFEVRILDEDDRPLPPGTSGQICIRPREPFAMFSGYHADDKRTVAAWRNLWFHSGDTGRIDNSGFLWFERRTEDVIRRLGEFIAAPDVEEAASRCAEVQLAAAFGVPSELAEEEVMLVVVRQPGALLTESGLRDRLSRDLPPFAVPRFLEFVDEIPMTPTGKVEKYRLRARGVGERTFDARARKEREVR